MCMLCLCFLVNTPGFATAGDSLQVPDDSSMNTGILDTMEIDASGKLPVMKEVNPEKLSPGGLDGNYFDRVITSTGDEYVVKVKDINIYEIVYTYPLNTIEQRMDKDMIKKIIFSDGSEQVISGEEVKEEKDWAVVVGEKDWEKVIILTSEDEIEGLKKLEEFKAKYVGNRIKTSSEYLEKNVMIILRKKTAHLKGNYLLVKEKQEYRAYGDLPYIEMTGIAYLRD